LFCQVAAELCPPLKSSSGSITDQIISSTENNFRLSNAAKGILSDTISASLPAVAAGRPEPGRCHAPALGGAGELG